MMHRAAWQWRSVAEYRGEVRRNLSVFAVLVALIVPTRAIANGPEVQYFGSTIVPIASKHIQLVSEDVEIDLSSSYARGDRNATCTYRLRNLADVSQRFSMAFVLGPPIGDGSVEERESTMRDYSFAVSQDGKPRAVRFVATTSEFGRWTDGRQDSMPAWDLSLPPHGTTTVVMKYSAGWDGHCDGGCYSLFRYYARPATLWAGVIERANFRFRLGDSLWVARLLAPSPLWSYECSPSTAKWHGEAVTWEFRNWEPDSDLVLAIGDVDGDYCLSDPSWSVWTSASDAAMPAVTTGLDRAPVLLADDCRAQPSCAWAHDGGRGALPIQLRLKVAADGSVEQVRCGDVPPSSEDLEEWLFGVSGSMYCARQWRFEPALLDGKPTDAWIDVTPR